MLKNSETLSGIFVVQSGNLKRISRYSFIRSLFEFNTILMSFYYFFQLQYICIGIDICLTTRRNCSVYISSILVSLPDNNPMFSLYLNILLFIIF